MPSDFGNRTPQESSLTASPPKPPCSPHGHTWAWVGLYGPKTGERCYCGGATWTRASDQKAAVERDRDALVRFIDAVSPFVRDVLDEPFPWQAGGQVITWLTREQYDEAVAALEALRD